MNPAYSTPVNQTLPADFDGIFRFTNPSDEPISCKWNGTAYTFPAMSTSPMIISGATPEEVQHIRKKFAKELAVREFYKGTKFKELDAQAPAGSGKTPAMYTEDDLTPIIQRCLEALPVARATATVLPKQTEDSFRKNDDGTNATVPLDKNASLVKSGAQVLAD